MKEPVRGKAETSISFRTSEDLKTRLERLADSHGRSLSQEVERLIGLGLVIEEQLPKTDPADIIREAFAQYNAGKKGKTP